MPSTLATHAPEHANDDGFPRAAASSVGIAPDKVIAFLDDVEAAGLDLHGLMLHRKGHVVAEGWSWPYAGERPRVLHSVAKSFTACAIGLAQEEGLLMLDDKVVSFFPEQLPEQYDVKLQDMTVEHLLTMRTGHESSTSGSVWRSISTSWITEFFKIPLAYEPGSHYVYTSAASYMLSAIISKVTGQTMHEYLRPRLFEPLGITDEHWDIGPDGINPGGNGLTARPVAMLKLAVLHAQGGLWQGQRILPAQWVAAATQPQGGSDSRYGYHWAIKPRHAYCAVGVFVQMAIVFPAHGATLMVVGGMKNSAELIPHIERHFPAAFFAEPKVDPLADAQLQQRLARMRDVPVLTSEVASPVAAPAIRQFSVAPNGLGVTRLSLAFEADKLNVQLTDATGLHSIDVGLNRWLAGRTDMPGRKLHHGYELADASVVAGARWLDAQTLEMTWIFVETAFKDTVRCVFTDQGVTFARRVNVNSSVLEQETLHGALMG